MVHMAERADGYIANLSKGMRQRVGLAQALVHQPEVLILDEPTIGLDPAQVVEVRNLIKEIGREHTVLLSTHNLAEAQQVCGRVLIINKGRIVAEDTPEHLQSRLTGALRVSMRVRGDAADLRPILENVDGVDSVTVKSYDTVEIESKAGTDTRPDAVRAAVKAGFDLLELQPASMTLEEIFLELTRDDIASPRSGDAANYDLGEDR
jgi:ABC-2 type transport system ATP-binding protein